MLRKCLTDPTQTIELPPQQLEKDLTYAEYPIKILDMQDRKLRYRVTKFLKVKWSRHSEEEATWELEEEIKKKFSYLFNHVM